MSSFYADFHASRYSHAAGDATALDTLLQSQPTVADPSIVVSPIATASSRALTTSHSARQRVRITCSPPRGPGAGIGTVKRR